MQSQPVSARGRHKLFNGSSPTSKMTASSRINFSTASCDKCYDSIFYFMVPLLHSFQIALLRFIMGTNDELSWTA